jgi:hypothetical protein
VENRHLVLALSSPDIASILTRRSLKLVGGLESFTEHAMAKYESDKLTSFAIEFITTMHHANSISQGRAVQPSPNFEDVKRVDYPRPVLKRFSFIQSPRVNIMLNMKTSRASPLTTHRGCLARHRRNLACLRHHRFHRTSC